MTRKSKQNNRAKGTKAISAPAAQGSKNTTMKPKMYYVGDTFVVEHCEYVQDVLTTTQNDFAYDVFQISPSNATTHPWLAPIAERFEFFRLRKMQSEFKSAVPTGTFGKLIMGMDYDPDDDTGSTTKSELLQWAGTSSENVWRDSVFHANHESMTAIGPWRYVNDTATTDSRLTTAGSLYVANTPVNAPMNNAEFVQVNLGELWIRYVYELKSPVIPTSLSTLAQDPQMASQYDIAAGFATNTNILTGMGPTSAPTITDFLDPYGIKIVNAKTNEYLEVGTASTYAANGEPMLVFEKDFQGVIDLASLGLTTNPLTAVTAKQYTNIETAGAFGNTLPPIPGPVANGDNYLTSIYNQVSGQIAAVQMYINVAKTTALILRAGAAAATGLAVKFLNVGARRDLRPKGDLASIRRRLPNLLEVHAPAAPRALATSSSSSTSAFPSDASPWTVVPRQAFR